MLHTRLLFQGRRPIMDLRAVKCKRSHAVNWLLSVYKAILAGGDQRVGGVPTVPVRLVGQSAALTLTATSTVQSDFPQIAAAL